MLAIPRGIIYQRLRDNIWYLLVLPFINLKNASTIRQFEDEFSKLINRDKCLAFPLARTAIYFALKAKNIAPGSEIIMPPISIKGILDVVLELKLKPVFVDLEINTLNFDIDKLNQAINPNTKAIIITYLFGIVPDLIRLTELCRQNNLFIIEDFSQCLNGEQDSKKVGSFGDVGVYSASSIKTLDTFGGGLLVCNDDPLFISLKAFQQSLPPPSKSILAKKIATNLLRNLATNRIFFGLFTFKLIKLISLINPAILLKQTGERSSDRLEDLPKEWFMGYSSLQAGFGLRLLKTLHTNDSARILNTEKIKVKVKDLKFPTGAKNTKLVYWQFICFFKNAIKAQASLAKFKIDTARSSLSKISNLKGYPVNTLTPNADFIYEHGLFIPSHFNLTKKDIQYVIHTLSALDEY